jgi:tRNA modification GTPase
VISEETIFALSTARGAAGLAVVRVSGPAASESLRSIAGVVPPARQVMLRRLRDPVSDETIDRGLVLFFAGPDSFTGEDVAEFHTHGSSAVVAGLLEALAALPGCRLAEPGEFTRRAFRNGKLDLTAAEGIADLIDAETPAQRRQALRQMDGAFAQLVEAWRQRLARLMAHLEAAIDFPEEDLPPGLLDGLAGDVATLAAEIRHQLDDRRRGEILRDGVSVAIIGPPNSGKSSLLNALVGREAAIVSAIAGTTRDVIEARLDLGGYPVILADTAGLRESADVIEAEGIRRARLRAEAADVTVLVLDAMAPEALSGFTGERDERCLLVWNKTDLSGAVPMDGRGLGLSVKTGQGLDALLAALSKKVAEVLSGPPAIVTRLRHRTALEECLEALERMFHVKHREAQPELVAEELRLGLRALGRITGKVDVEDLLDIVFREFCIGK